MYMHTYTRARTHTHAGAQTHLVMDVVLQLGTHEKITGVLVDFQVLAERELRVFVCDRACLCAGTSARARASARVCVCVERVFIHIARSSLTPLCSSPQPRLCLQVL